MARNRNEIDDKASYASFVGIGLPVIVIAAAIALYFLWPASDSVNRAEVVPPPAATSEPAPKTTPDEIKVTPQSEQKAPPAAEPTPPTKDRDPRVDSNNSN